MEEKKTVSVKIGNMTYQISAREDSKYIEEIAKEADELIHSIQANKPELNPINIAILALINALDQKTKLENSFLSDDQNKIAQQKDFDDLNAEKLQLRELCWNLKKELLYYKNLCEVYEERIHDLNQITVQDKMPNRLKNKNNLKPLDKLQTSFPELNKSDENES
ncbi:MAG: cell division protein ZapA [Clostridiaceae bacterium]|nr:cell division protein ZapA [Clostridiaceae bacterium]